MLKRKTGGRAGAAATMPTNSTEYARYHRAANPECYREAARRYYHNHRAEVLRRATLRRANAPGAGVGAATLARHGIVFCRELEVFVLAPSLPTAHIM